MNTTAQTPFPFLVSAILLLIAATPVHTPLIQSGQASVAASAAAVQVDMLPDAPDFELKTTDGRTLRLRDFRGQAIVLNFWATWCVPCKQEIPWLIDFQNQYRQRGLLVLGISMDNSPVPVRKFAHTLGVNYPILMGNQSIADKYFVKGLPVSIYIDRNGRITDQVPGLSTRSFMENEIKLALENGTRQNK